jgi:hypothetical protein
MLPKFVLCHVISSECCIVTPCPGLQATTTTTQDKRQASTKSTRGNFRPKGRRHARGGGGRFVVVGRLGSADPSKPSRETLKKKEINKQKPGEERERKEELISERERKILAAWVGREVGACGPRIPRGFYFLSRPVLSSPPSVRPPPLLPPLPSFLLPSISPSPPVPPPHTPQPTALLLQRPPRLASSPRSAARARQPGARSPSWLVEPRGWWRQGFVLERRRRGLCPEEIGDAGGRGARAELGSAGSLGVAGPPGPMP